MLQKRVALGLVVILFLCPIPVTDAEDDAYIEIVSDSIITVDHIFQEEGKGVAFVFDYILDEGTTISWDLESERTDTYFDLLIFDDLQSPFSSDIVFLTGLTSTDSHVVVPHSSAWFMVVRHPWASSDHPVHITGTIEQNGTGPPYSAFSIVTTPRNIPDSTSYDPSGSIVLVLGIAGVLFASLGVVYLKQDRLFKEKGVSAEVLEISMLSLDIPRDKIEDALKEIEVQFSDQRKVEIPVLRDAIFSAASVPYDRVSEILECFKDNRMIIENSDNTYSLTSEYRDLKGSLLDSLE